MNKQLNLHEVINLIDASSESVHRWEKLGLFPKRFKINARNVRWHENEIKEWLGTGKWNKSTHHFLLT
jgi:predicted DNA-binding transcriptional regulator AlpA